MSVETELRRAAKLAKTGKTVEAARLYRGILERFPGNLQARRGLQALGPVTARPSRPPGGSATPPGYWALAQAFESGAFRQVLTGAQSLVISHPGHAPSWNLLGLAQAKAGHHKAAVASYSRAIELDRTLAIAAHNRTASLIALGRREEAAASALLTVALAPDFAEGHLSAGFALAAIGEADKAKARFQAVAQSEAPAPQIARAMIGLGNLALASKDHDAAISRFRKAIALQPDDIDAVNNLGVALDAHGDFDLAIDVLEPACKRHPNAQSLANNLVVSLVHDGQLQAARIAAERALEIAPDNARSWTYLGKCLTDLGDRDAARDAINQAVALQPHLDGAFIEQMRIDPPAPGSADHDRLAAILRSPDAVPVDAVAAGFILFGLHDALGETEHAFKWLDEANRRRRVNEPYEIANDRRVFAALKARSEVPSDAATSPEPSRTRPVFIVGMPRSGTTLVEQILARHSSVHAAGELRHLGRTMSRMGWTGSETGRAADPEVLAALRNDYLAVIDRLAGGKPVVTDKMPLNFRFLGFALAAIPEARVLFTRRDPRATCWSNYRQNFSGGGNRFGNSLTDLGAYYQMHLDLMETWIERFPDRIHTVCYERLTTDQEEQSRALVAAAGLEWEPACLEFHKTDRIARTASRDQVRRKMYTGSSEAWRRYEPFLGPMLDTLHGLPDSHLPAT